MLPGVINRTFGNRTQSNSVTLFSLIRFYNLTPVMFFLIFFFTKFYNLVASWVDFKLISGFFLLLYKIVKSKMAGPRGRAKRRHLRSVDVICNEDDLNCRASSGISYQCKFIWLCLNRTKTQGGFINNPSVL